MKMVKSLLLGSAAGLVAISGTQAADLPVKAKAVEYVKVCSLYGEGFYYIPGTDTCIRIGGYVRADYNYNGRSAYVQGAPGAQDRTVSYYTTRHRFTHNIDTRTQTAYGTLRTYGNVNFEVAEGAATAGTSRAFIQWAGFTFGRTSSFVDHEGSLGDSGMKSLYTGLVDSTTGAAGINQIAYTWELGSGMTLNVGADEPRNSSVFNASNPFTQGGSGATSTGFTFGADPISSRAGTNHPDPWVSFRVSQAWGKASLAFIAHKNSASSYSNTNFVGATPAGCASAGAPLFPLGNSNCGAPDDKWGWAVLSGIEISLREALSPGSRMGMYGTFGQGAARMSANSQTSPGLFGSGNTLAFGINTDAVFLNGGQMELTTHWSAGGGLEYYWTPIFSTTIYGGYSRFEYNDTVVNGAFFCRGGAGLAQVFTQTAAAPCDPSYSLWQIGTVINWYPVKNLRLALDVQHTGVVTGFDGQTLALARPFGGTGAILGTRPPGNYLISDDSITQVMFRVERSY